jgi:ABC-type glycerol-3-phosphate transport system substrate-binding protein
VLRQTTLWGTAVATTAAGVGATGCAPGATGGAEPARLSAGTVTIRFPAEATPPNEAYLAQVTARVRQRYEDKIRISPDPWLGSWNERYEKWTAQALAGDAYWKDGSQVNAIVVKHLRATYERNEVPVAEATRLMVAEIRGFYGAR